MDNITKIGDVLRLQRPLEHPLPLESTLNAAMPAAARETPEFTDTVVFRSPVVEVDRDKLDALRILSSGAPGPIGSAYKMLRTQVMRRMEHLGASTLAVLSPTAGDGKTLSAINLAIAVAAETDRTVLLVDFDLRNPSIHRRFGFEPKLGVEDCLETKRPLQEAMVKIAGYERLTVLPARRRVEHSSELLGSRGAADMVNEMRARYANRILIFDMPPVLQADDALTFSRYVQSGLLVVSEGKTRRDDVTRSIGLLRDLPIVGTVLNGSREPLNTYY